MTRITSIDEIGIDVQERPACGHAGVVDQQVDCRVAGDHAGRKRLDGVAVADVAELDLAADLVRERTQALLPARDEHAMPAAFREQAGGRLADSRRSTCDDGDARHCVNVTQSAAARQSVSPQWSLRARR